MAKGGMWDTTKTGSMTNHTADICKHTVFAESKNKSQPHLNILKLEQVPSTPIYTVYCGQPNNSPKSH